MSVPLNKVMAPTTSPSPAQEEQKRKKVYFFSRQKRKRTKERITTEFILWPKERKANGGAHAAREERV
jgi:hypothetical protein